MNDFQKIIKYVAIGLAVILSIIILSSIAKATFAIITVVSGGNLIKNQEGTVDFNKSFTGVENLDINNSTGKLILKTGETIQIKAENVSKYFKAEVSKDGTLVVKEDDNISGLSWFHISGFRNPNSKITVYLPSDFKAEDTKIESGAGEVSIENLNSEYLNISAGAGNIKGYEINADDVKIDGGVGNISLKSVSFHDADFNCGLGNLTVTGELLGKTKIDCGIGEVNLELIGDVEDYDLDIDSGIGTIRLNGEKLSNEYNTDKNARNSIKVDGGIGNVKINLED